jgi:dihydroorotase
VLAVDRGTLKAGADADITIIDPAVEWTIDVMKLASRSRNSPFHGRKVRGRAHAVIVSGEIKSMYNESSQAPG